MNSNWATKHHVRDEKQWASAIKRTTLAGRLESSRRETAKKLVTTQRKRNSSLATALVSAKRHRMNEVLSALTPAPAALMALQPGYANGGFVADADTDTETDGGATTDSGDTTDDDFGMDFNDGANDFGVNGGDFGMGFDQMCDNFVGAPLVLATNTPLSFVMGPTSSPFPMAVDGNERLVHPALPTFAQCQAHSKAIRLLGGTHVKGPLPPDYLPEQLNILRSKVGYNSTSASDRAGTHVRNAKRKADSNVVRTTAGFVGDLLDERFGYHAEAMSNNNMLLHQVKHLSDCGGQKAGLTACAQQSTSTSQCRFRDLGDNDTLSSLLSLMTLTVPSQKPRTSHVWALDLSYTTNIFSHSRLLCKS
jgi:hypothetical protein